jgi:peptide/nickel transport system permease protein
VTMSDVAVRQKMSRSRRPRSGVLVAVSLGFLGVVVCCATFLPLASLHDPAAQDLANVLVSPDATHWFGTDALGRDVFWRTVDGARSAIVGPLLVALGAMVIGNVLGLIAGYRGRATDGIIMRWADLMYALPALLIAIVIVGVVGGGYYWAVCLLIVLYSPYDTRIVRSATLDQRSRPYVEAARTLGLSRSRIMFWHIWPNVLPLALANAFLTFAFALVTLSSLSFLGLGAPPGSTDWGRMLAENRTFIFEAPAAALAPGIMLVLTAASMNIVGDWLYEAFADRGRLR